MPRLRHCSCAAVLVVLAVLAGAGADAQAAGMYLTPRGVRALGMAGAFVAGADGFEALSYNPAGLAGAKNSAFVDFGLALHSTEYTRRVFADSPDLPTVAGKGLGLPLPGLGVTFADVGKKGLGLGAGVWAPYPLLQNWPCDLSGNNPTPQRYALCNYNGTAMVNGGIGIGYRVDHKLALGVGVQVLVGKFVTAMVTSSCDGAICTQAENPDYDVATQMDSHPLVSPGLQGGATYEATDWLRLGLALESGYLVKTKADLRVRLQAAALADNATLDPAEPVARLTLKMPPMVRLGAEAHWGKSRVELALSYEFWRVHDQLEVDVPEATIRDMVALGDYPWGKVIVDRGFRDAFSARLGGEADLGMLVPGLVVRAGAMYERSAVPPEKLTAMSVDLNKLVATVGASYALRAGWTVDAVFAHLIMPDATVTTSTALQTNPIRPPWPGRTPIGNGVYQSRANVVGVGATYAW